jgi:hypothetical protein
LGAASGPVGINRLDHAPRLAAFAAPFGHGGAVFLPGCPTPPEAPSTSTLSARFTDARGLFKGKGGLTLINGLGHVARSAEDRVSRPLHLLNDLGCSFLDLKQPGEWVNRVFAFRDPLADFLANLGKIGCHNHVYLPGSPYQFLQHIVQFLEIYVRHGFLAPV